MRLKLNSIMRLSKVCEPITGLLLKQLVLEIRRLRAEVKALKAHEIKVFEAGFNRGTQEGAKGVDLFSMEKSALGLLSEQEQEITKKTVIPA